MKKFLAVFFVLFFGTTAFSETVSETFLSELGIGDFSVEGTNAENCREIEFIASDFSDETYYVFSLHADFLPVASRESSAEIEFNGEKLTEISPEEFRNGYARIVLPNEIAVEKNSLKVCLGTSFATTRAVMLNDSFIGNYFMEDFSKPDSFTITVFPQSPRLFEEFKATVTLKNYGSRDKEVTIRYRKESLEKETPETEFLSGKTTYKVLIKKCAERNEEGVCTTPSSESFEFLMRPKALGQITLLPAIAEYENEFGELVSIESNRPNVLITEPEIKLRAFVTKPKEEYFVGQDALLKLLLVNDSQYPLFNIKAEIETEGLGVSINQKEVSFDYIGAKSTVEREFTLSASQPTVAEIGCSVSYLEKEITGTLCEKTSVKFKSQELPPEIMAGIFLVLVSAASFIYIFYIKK